MKKNIGILYIIAIFLIALLILFINDFINSNTIVLIIMFSLIIGFSIFIYTCIFLIQKQTNVHIKKILFSWYFVLWFLINGLTLYFLKPYEFPISLVLTLPLLVLAILLFFKKIQNNNNLN